MESKIMQIFYGNDCLPYKDKDRVVHYPIIGSAFQGASQTTEIRFYIDRIGGTNATWVAVSKLPNGKVGTKILESSYDYELDENYVTLQLSSFYTQAKGDLYVSLQGYEGGVQVEYDSETEIYDVVGTPVIQATGSVKIAINYATQYVGSDENEQITVQEALALVSGKADTEYVKYGRLVHDITISNIPLVDPTGIDTDDYEPSQSEQLNEYFDNGIPMGIYDEEVNYSFVLVCSPRLFSETLDSPTNIVAMYRSARLDEQGKGKYLLVFLSPNKKFYAYLFSDSDVIYADDYATKNLVDYLISKYGETGNVLEVYQAQTTLNDTQQKQINRRDCVIKYLGNLYRKISDTENIYNLVSLAYTNNIPLFLGNYFEYDTETHILKFNFRQANFYAKDQTDNLFGVKLEIDEEFKLSLVNNNNQTLATVDLPLESVVVSGEYDSVNKQIILTLEDGSTVEIPVGDLVEGLVDEQGLEEALQPYVKEIEVSSVLTTNDLLEEIGLNKNFVLDNMGDPLLCYISEESGTYTLSMVGKNKSNIATFTENTLVINLLGDATLDIDYLPIIELSSAMQTLTSAQLEIANQDNSVIKYGNRLYNKANVGDTSIEFVSVDYDIITDSESHRLTKYEITVNRTTGATNMITFYVNFYSDGELENKLEDYAKVDGNYPTMTVGIADNLSPYGDESGALQEEPFIAQASGTDNNTEIVTVGEFAELKRKNGNSVVVNQLVNYASVPTGSSNGITFTNNNDGSYTATGSSTGYAFKSFALSLVVGHKYLITGAPKGGESDKWGLSISTPSVYDYGTNTIFTATITSPVLYMFVQPNNNNVNLKYVPQLIDLTQWFNGDIPQDLLNNPSHFSWYHNFGSYILYNTGELVNASGQYLTTTGRNLWDGTHDIIVIPTATYYCYGSATLTYKDKEGNTISSETKEDEAFTLPTNCYLLGVSGSSDICISLYYTPEQGGEGYDKYYAYEEPHVYDTGDETLRSAGSVCDYKTPDGTIHRVVGTRAYQSGDENDASVITDGINTYYPLAEPTTEQGTPFSKNILINDYGMMYWDSDIPQGNSIFYPVNYKGFIDDMYSRVDGDSSKYVAQSELSAIDDKYDDLYAIMQENIGGALRHQLAQANSLDFLNTAWVDLGSLTWTYRSADGVFSLPANTLQSIKSNGKVLCGLYKQHNVAVASMLNMEVNTTELYNAHDIIIKNTSYTDATAFKNAMKGILLAYEKA